VTTAAGVRNLLFVTTRDGRIVALDAQTGATVWSHQYNPPGCNINNDVSSGACYTTSSPAIDPNRLYVYSYGLDGEVHKHLVGDGAEIVNGNWPQVATVKGFDEKGSSALAIAGSSGTAYLYMTHSGYPGDHGDYQGHVTAINLTTGGQNVFNVACSDRLAHLQTFGAGGGPHLRLSPERHLVAPWGDLRRGDRPHIPGHRQRRQRERGSVRRKPQLERIGHRPESRWQRRHRRQ
jgi:PQQ enzyme repeat